MSFLTEYFDEYRQHPIKKTKICRPEERWAKLEGNWMDPKVGTQDKAWTEEEIESFIKSTMKSLRGQSTYYNDYCAHLSPGRKAVISFTNIKKKLLILFNAFIIELEFKTRPFKPRVKVLKPCKIKDEPVTEEAPQLGPKLAIKDTELMKVARDLYERDMDKPTLEPLPTHLRILGYVRPCLYKTGISDYQYGVARLAYEMIRDDRIPRYHAHNGCRPHWGLPPEGTRQPELDGAPFNGERLY